MPAAARHLVLRIGVAVAIFALVSRHSREAWAGDVAVARATFAEGVKLYQRDDYEGARRLFKRAEAEHHAAPIVYNIGLAEERLGHLQAAVDAYEAYVAELGDAGELSPAAVIAIAQIKSRSTRLRIETKPPGARVFVDGSMLPEASPTTFLVPSGHHLVVAQGDAWRAEQDLEATGSGDAVTIVLGPSESTTSSPVPVPVAPVGGVAGVPGVPGGGTAAPDRIPGAPEAAKPSGFVWGASFALVPYHLEGARLPMAPNGAAETQVMAGAFFEAGHAVTDRFEFLGRGFVGLGPEGRPSFAFMGGPGVSFRLGSSLWLGATFIGGQLETRARDRQYSTGPVFGAMAEAAIVLLETAWGQWTVGIQPGLLLTSDPVDNTAYFVPVSFGYRAF